jgi:hypothetical protein
MARHGGFLGLRDEGMGRACLERAVADRECGVGQAIAQRGSSTSISG